MIVLAQRDAVPPEKVAQNLAAHRAKVAGDNQVIVLWRAMGVLQVLADGLIGRRRHGAAHVIGVGDALVDHLPDGCRAHVYRPPALSQQHAARTGHGPLGCGRALAAIFQRQAILPLGRCKVGRGHGGRPLGIAAVDHHGCHQQALRHGGAGAVQSQKWHALPPHGKAGADALVQQVAGAEHVQLLRRKKRFLQRPLQRLLLHLAFGLFPSFLAEFGILRDHIEPAGQRTLTLFFAHDAGPGQQRGRCGKAERPLSQPLICHDIHILLLDAASMCSNQRRKQRKCWKCGAFSLAFHCENPHVCFSLPTDILSAESL